MREVGREGGREAGCESLFKHLSEELLNNLLYNMAPSSMNYCCHCKDRVMIKGSRRSRYRDERWI